MGQVWRLWLRASQGRWHALRLVTSKLHRTRRIPHASVLVRVALLAAARGLVLTLRLLLLLGRVARRVLRLQLLLPHHLGLDQLVVASIRLGLCVSCFDLWFLFLLIVGLVRWCLIW